MKTYQMKSRRLVKGLRRFLRGESGLVTIEWVGIAAIAAVGAIAVSGMIYTNLANESGTVPTQICNNADTAGGDITAITGNTALTAC